MTTQPTPAAEVMPPLPDPKYIYHDNGEAGAEDLHEFAASGAVDENECYPGGICPYCERLYLGDQVHAYAQQYAAPIRAKLEAARADIELLRATLVEIGDYAHAKSTGPTVPDALWLIRRRAYQDSGIAELQRALTTPGAEK